MSVSSFMICLINISSLPGGFNRTKLVFPISATYLLYFLLKDDKATNVTSLLYCIPPVTSILDYLIYGQSLPIQTIIGMGLVLAGLLLIKRFNSK